MILQIFLGKEKFLLGMFLLVSGAKQNLNFLSKN